MKAKSNAQATSVLALELAAHRDQGIALPARLLRSLDALGIFLLVLELQYVGRAELGADLAGAAGVEETDQAHARPDRHVEAALGADLEVLLEFRPVQHHAAAVAFFPQAFRHAALPARGRFGADAGRHQFLQPGHAFGELDDRRWPDSLAQGHAGAG